LAFALILGVLVSGKPVEVYAADSQNDNWETELSFAGDIKGVKSVGKNALKGIHAKATIKVPKAKLDKYKKVFKGKGQGKNVKVKKA